MAVTDLTNTKWLFNEGISSFEDITYNINFTSNSTSFSQLMSIEGNHSVHYDNTSVFSRSSWVNDAYRTIEITGGTDVTNSNLISWLTSNATQIVEDNPLVETTISVGTKKLYNAYLGQGDLEKIYKGTSLIFNRLEANFETSDHNLLITSNGDIFNVQEATQLGSFTIQLAGGGFSPNTFNFEIGMTWADFINSQYNAGDYFTDGNPVMYLSNIVMSHSTGSWLNVYGSDTIVNGEAYGYHSGGDN